MPSSQYSSKRDANFCFPIPNALENDTIEIVPFIPSKHVEEFFSSSQDEKVWQYLPIGPFASPSEFASYWEKHIVSSDQHTLFVILDKTTLKEDGKSPYMAGMIGYMNSKAVDLVTEIAFVIVFPKFQQSHVASNAVGLLMHYALDLPENGGLGLRRVQWAAGTKNSASVRLAERMGFKIEGVLKWARILAPAKTIASNGGPERKGDPRAGCPSSDTALLAVYWDNWENGLREKVDQVMGRRIDSHM
ncbi:hypothetical protein D9758_006218 [Tetrapyrgos nigripes]|uniref:N-acetyltransferase domain-containing protein n=1 Tax=Tetrapyrgos nigripes TaxID=182062 RepID=A0A8H5LLC0_9AGAR|nr:hypothetical protein D9758_006218 [Tetrapyrgos nigripes]